jgi:hypothetical protein
MPLGKACFWPKIGAILQKNGGSTEIILHFFSRFPGFLGFVPLQAIASQGQPAIKTLPKKSCLKTYRRFFVRSGLCHNRRMNGKIVQWEMGRKVQDKNLHVVGRAGISPESSRGCCAAQELRAERQLCPTRKVQIFVMRPGPGETRRHSDTPAIAGSQDPQFTPLPTAIQPGSSAVSTSQYK